MISAADRPPGNSFPPVCTGPRAGLEHNREILRVFGRNTLWLLLDRAGLKMAAMLAGVAVIGYLGPANVGIYTTAIAVGSLLNAFLDLGLTRYAARSVAADPAEAPAILAVTLLITVLVAMVESVAIALSLAHGALFAACICIGLLFTNIDGTCSVCSNILCANLRGSGVFSGSVVSTAGSLTAIFLVVHFRWSVLGLLTAMAAKSVVVLLFRFYQVRDARPWSIDLYRPATFRRVLRRSWPYYSYSLTQIAYEKAAIVAFGLVATPSAVGLVSAALVLAGVFPSFSYAASDSLLPVMTRLYEAARIAELRDLLRRLLDLLLYLCIPVSLLLALFANEICGVLGARFIPSAIVLHIVAFRSILSILDNFLGQSGLTAVARVSERRNAQIAGLAATIVLVLVLGSVWGTLGAAVGIVVSDLLILARYVMVYRRIGLAIVWGAMWAVACASAAMVSGAMATHGLPVAVRAGVAVAAYGVAVAGLARGRAREAARTFRACFLPA